jgi:hypothetical protein
MTAALELRDQSIITQVAAKIAADLAGIAGRDIPIGDVVADWAVAFPTIQEAIVDSINAAIATGAFEGSTFQPGAAQTVPPVQAAAPAGPAPAPTPAPAPGPAAGPAPAGPAAGPSGPAAIPGAQVNDAAQLEADWQDLWANPNDWYDNRTTKDDSRKPDFRHKSKKRGKYNIGLYVTDKKNPQWVKDFFGV